MEKIEEKQPCKVCTKLTYGWTAEGMGEKTREANKNYIEGNRVWLCPDCIDQVE